ncbi:hypothetical protein, partial [Histophilus somni]|uniref:hypothetical protein n=1 Tax=Histophilus somni TaxID=731 RepID=UPI00201E7981
LDHNNKKKIQLIILKNKKTLINKKKDPNNIHNNTFIYKKILFILGIRSTDDLLLLSSFCLSCNLM